MSQTQIVKMLIRIAKEDLEDGEIVTVTDIGDILENKCGKVRWSHREISGSLMKVKDIYIPSFIDKKSGLRQYQIVKTC